MPTHKELKAEYDRRPEQKMRRQKYNKVNMKEYHKQYSKQYHLLTKYNLTIEAYDFILHQQNYKCAVCNTHISKLTTPMNVDHDHTTGKVRGLLCGPCNRGIGQLRDDYVIVQAAADYLLKHIGGGQ